MIFLAFLGVLVISVAVTFFSLEAQQEDARIINLAGRQRMLLQQMAHLAENYDGDENSDTSRDLLAAAGSFNQTLVALQGGGSIVDYTGERFTVPKPDNLLLRSELAALQKDWQDYRQKIGLLVQSAAADQRQAATKAIETLSPGLVDQADRVVRAYEVVSTARINQLRLFQGIFLLLGLALMAFGWWLTNRSIVRPLASLEQSAKRIGEGDLSSSVRQDGPAEVALLGGAIETMRAQILTSRQDLERWADTLEERVQRRTRELEALAAVSQEINSHLSIQEVLTSVTEKARGLLGAELASLCLLDAQGKMLSLHAAAAPETAIRTNQSPADDPQAGAVLHEQCAHPCGMQTRHSFCRIIDPAYRVSHLAAPLTARDKVIGALCVGSSRPDAFRPEMATALKQLSSVAAVALDNSRLYQQAEYAATLEERQRIASEMHDGLLQTLNFLRLMAQMMEGQLAEGSPELAMATVRQIERAEEQAQREIRQAIASLQDDFPLNDTLQERLSVLAAELSVTPPRVTFESRVIFPLVLSRQDSEQTLRVAREAILNAQRYSRADCIAVCLEKCGKELVLSVCDNGVGFIPGTDPADGRAHFGLKIMQARAARLGGNLSIRSTPGDGTRVELRWTPAVALPE